MITVDLKTSFRAFHVEEKNYCGLLHREVVFFNKPYRTEPLYMFKDENILDLIYSLEKQIEILRKCLK